LGDLNPLAVVKSLTSSPPSNKCGIRKLPVGNSIDQIQLMYADRNQYLKNASKCVKSCRERYATATTSDKISNCLKTCSRGWWLEPKCTSNTKIYKYGNKEYFNDQFLPSPITDVNNGFIFLVVVVFVFLFLLLCVFYKR